MEMAKTLGCTGGIGSGKSYVSNIFAQLGYPVYYSDDRAKLLYDTDSELLQQMVELLGRDILNDGKIDRRIMASRIFADVQLLRRVEGYVHPAVLRDFKKWKREQEFEYAQKGQKLEFVIFESAILLESPLVASCADKVLVVSAPYGLRIERVIARDGVTRAQVEERMARQWSDDRREALADFIIFADSKRALLPQIADVIEKMKGE